MFENSFIAIENNNTTVEENLKSSEATTTQPIDKELILTLCFCSVLAIFLVIIGLCFKPKVINSFCKLILF